MKGRDRSFIHTVIEVSVDALQRGMEAGRVRGHELFSSSATVSPGFPSSTPTAPIPEDPEWACRTAQQGCVFTGAAFNNGKRPHGNLR